MASDAAASTDAAVDLRVVAARLAAEGPDAARDAARAALRAALSARRAAARTDFAQGRLGGRGCAAALSAAMDAVVRGALDVAALLHPNPTPTSGERIAVAAVGGYGRGEMAPSSDVDLLFLRPYKKTPWGESLIETTLYLLWDLKLKVGYAVRTPQECLRQARDDVTVRTSLLERRSLWGDAAAVDELGVLLQRELFSRTGPEFIEAKLAERDARHTRQGGSRYLVEPNVKEGKGGLRDLQTLYWIAKYVHQADDAEALVRAGALTSEELARFAAAEEFLWTVRTHLHWLCGRGQEQLSFDLQVEVADSMGYAARGGRRGVEWFMQDYFRAAKDVGDLTRWYCAVLEQQHKKAGAPLSRLARAFGVGAPATLGAGFRLRDGRVDLDEPDLFARHPAAMMRLFETGLETGALLHPNAMRAVAANLDRVDDALRADPEANAAFLRLLTASRDPERALRRMNESGFLGRFIPQFGRIVAMMQFNMYHHYTVDEHTIMAVATLSRLAAGALEGDLPVASEIMRAGVDMTVLATAVFLHDIGKGLPEDHSEVGAVVARDLCPRLGLDPAQCALVEWLVRRHLLMSDTAQKRDIADPQTVRAFADEVRTPERLRLLLVLTVCDIRAVGPGVWNNWKAQLLRTLFWDTRAVLTGGAERLSRADRVAEAVAALRAALPDFDEAALQAEAERHYAPYWLSLDAGAHAGFARLQAEGRAVDGVRLAVEADPARDAARVLILSPDAGGLFSRMAAGFALARASIVEARSYTTADGVATSAFWVQAPGGGPYDPDRFARLERSLRRAMAKPAEQGSALAERRRAMRRRERPFEAPTRISFDNEASDIYTVIEVDTRDRVGLLSDLTAALHAAAINIHSAVVATYGEQAVDVFYVKDIFGLKLNAASKQKAVARRLREAIARAAAQAPTPQPASAPPAAAPSPQPPRGGAAPD